MHVRYVLLTVVCLFFISSQSWAQAGEKPRVSIYANTGFTDPVGPDAFNETWNIGYNVGGGVGIRINDRMIIRPYVLYNSFGLDADALPDDVVVPEGAVASGSFSTLTVTAEMLVGLPYNPFFVQPYFIIGAGYFKGETSGLQGLDQQVYLGIEGIGKGVFGLDGGIGLKAHLGNHLGAFVEGKVVVGFTGRLGMIYAPITIGVMAMF